MSKPFISNIDISSIKQLSLEIEPYVINWRRHFHQYPELGFQEKNTSSFICKLLSHWNIPYTRHQTGIVAIIKGSRRKSDSIYSEKINCVGLRTDMDALPISDKSGVLFSSKRKNVMHACGHDGHIAILLGTLWCLIKLKDLWKGTVKAIFQPSEETLEGARYMVKQKVMSFPKVDIILGFHLMNLPLGTIGCAPGSVMSMISIFTIEVSGIQGHGSSPEAGKSSIYIASKLIEHLQKVYNYKCKQATSINIGEFISHGAFNIISEHSTLQGSFRCYNNADQLQIRQNILDLLHLLSTKHDVPITISYHGESKPIYNNPILAKKIGNVLKTSGYSINQTFICPGSEDFGEYLEHAPGLFFFLGVKKDNLKKNKNFHSSHFILNEKALKIGVEMLTVSTLYLLKN
jgi:amidohydrolase